MPEKSAESDHTAVAVERLTEAVGSSASDVADAAAVTVNVGDLRRLLRVVTGSLAVTYQSPNGTSLTRCCCDRTTARLIVCPVHPDVSNSPAKTVEPDDWDEGQCICTHAPSSHQFGGQACHLCNCRRVNYSPGTTGGEG